MPANVPNPISAFAQTTVRDPNGLVPTSVLTPLTTYAEKLADFQGYYTGFTTGIRPISAATTAGLPTSSLGIVVSYVVPNGLDTYPMMLQQSTAATSVPLVVQAGDYSTTNQVGYRLLNWHSAAFMSEGISGLGYFSMQPQTVNPGVTSTLLLSASTTYGLVVASPAGSLTIPTSGYPQTSFLQRNGTWAPSVSGLYTPGNVSAWNGPPPTTIQQALDRLAAVASSKP